MVGKRLLAIVPIVLSLACGMLFVLRSVNISSSFDDLISSSSKTIPMAVRDRASNLVPVIISAKDEKLAKNTTERLSSAIYASGLTNYCARIKAKGADDGLSLYLNFYRANGSGLVAEQVKDLLQTPEGRAKIAKAAVRKYYSSPMPPLFSAEEDPFCLLDGFVTSLPKSYAGWTLENGMLMSHYGDKTHFMIVLETKPKLDLSQVTQFYQLLTECIRSCEEINEVQIVACGAPLHTAISANKCKQEIGLLTWVSLAFIALLSIIVFRGVKWIPLIALTLITSASAGFLVLVLVFKNLHLLSLVIGTTLLGLVVDYAFHWMLHSQSHRNETRRNLIVSFVTTEVGLLPLVLSSIPILRQSSVFLGVGLFAALSYVLFCYPCSGLSARNLVGFSAIRFMLIPITLMLVIVGGVGIKSLHIGTDITALYRPPASLFAAEKLFTELNGGKNEDQGFVVVNGKDLEARILRESLLVFSNNVPRISSFLPPIRVRELIYNDVLKLYVEQGQRQAELLGYEKLKVPNIPREWKECEIPRDIKQAFCGDTALIFRASKPISGLGDYIQFCHPVAMLAEMLTIWTQEAFGRLIISIGLMFVILFVLCRGRSIRIILPSMLAILVMGGVISLCGEKINLFHLLACFLLAGMGVDYAVFVYSNHSIRPAICSLLTSMVGFGALGFVSFPLVKSLGLALGGGLPIAFIFALVLKPRQSRTEHGASPIGLEILWFIYQLLGLRFLHFASAIVGCCVWVFSRSVRRASPSVMKMINFTRSLADKLVVMAEGKCLPTIEFDDSPDAREFVSAVKLGRGVFVLSSHCGTIEMLVAAGECAATFHAWMDFDRTSVFNRFYLRHSKRNRVVIHPISEIGMETAFFAGDALERGDCLVMAGDRGHGAFRFARSLEHPTYFVACVWCGNKYRAFVHRLPNEKGRMEDAYENQLEKLKRDFPDQWFTWS